MLLSLSLMELWKNTYQFSTKSEFGTQIFRVNEDEILHFPTKWIPSLSIQEFIHSVNIDTI